MPEDRYKQTRRRDLMAKQVERSPERSFTTRPYPGREPLICTVCHHPIVKVPALSFSDNATMYIVDGEKRYRHQFPAICHDLLHEAR